jgi:adenylate cyclase class 2
MDGLEIEAKFFVREHKQVIRRLRALKARLTQRRVLERNVRFDRPDSGLRAEGRVLRLRADTQARLTYKGPSSMRGGAASRREIEFSVESFEAAQALLEALGYTKKFYYEKYRATYQLAGTHVMLDELPYGLFVEIEGQNAKSIRETAKKLGLDARSAIGASYTTLFERARKRLRLKFKDLTFKDFKKARVRPEDLGVRQADG